MADSIIGIQGKDFVMVAADMTSSYSILKFKTNEDKILQLDGNKLLAIGGPVGDRVQFGDYIDKNIRFLKLKNNGVELTTREAANYIRLEKAKAIRSEPVQCNSLIAGCDSITGPQLFWIDYMGTIVQSKHICQGYAMHFLMGVFDRLYQDNMDQAQALQLIKYCIHELKVRFLLGDDNFIVKCVSNQGVSHIKL